MLRAKYVGPKMHLRGAIALFADGGPGFISVQTNDPALSRKGLLHTKTFNWQRRSLGYGWHPFPETHWEILQ